MVDRGGLENRCTFTGTVGSNPTASANDFEYRRSARSGYFRSSVLKDFLYRRFAAGET